MWIEKDTEGSDETDMKTPTCGRQIHTYRQRERWKDREGQIDLLLARELSGFKLSAAPSE